MEPPATRFLSRETRDGVGMKIAEACASRSTCIRRSVGCLLVDRFGRTLSTGHNGVAMGQPHCNDPGPTSPEIIQPTGTWMTNHTYPNRCSGSCAESGKSLDSCHALHAEWNALMFCQDVMQIHTCYVTTSPCITCTKMLMNTSCQKVIFGELYPHEEARTLWEGSGRIWHQYNPMED